MVSLEADVENVQEKRLDDRGFFERIKQNIEDIGRNIAEAFSD